MLVIIDGCGWRREEGGDASRLADIALTTPAVMGLLKPNGMTSRVLFSR